MIQAENLDPYPGLRFAVTYGEDQTLIQVSVYGTAPEVDLDDLGTAIKTYLSGLSFDSVSAVRMNVTNTTL